jgi:hypothetical protein
MSLHRPMMDTLSAAACMLTDLRRSHHWPIDQQQSEKQNALPLVMVTCPDAAAAAGRRAVAASNGSTHKYKHTSIDTDGLVHSLARSYYRPPAGHPLAIMLFVRANAKLPVPLCGNSAIGKSRRAYTHDPGRSSDAMLCVCVRMVWIMCRTMVMNIPFITARWRPGRHHRPACIELLMHPSATLSAPRRHSRSRTSAGNARARPSQPISANCSGDSGG